MGTLSTTSGGSLVVKPVTAGTTIGVGTGSGTLSLPASYFSSNFANGFSNITIGSATTGNIAVSGVTFSDSLTLYAGNPNANISLAGTIANAGTGNSSGGFTVKAAGTISMSAGTSVTTQNQSIILWSDSDASGVGSIQIGGTSSAVSISSNGGHIWMGGGSGSTTWNGLTVGDGYAIGNTGSSNIDGMGIDLEGVTVNAGGSGNGGNISLNGQGGYHSGGGVEFGVTGFLASVKTNNAGTIDINGLAGAGNSGADAFFKPGIDMWRGLVQTGLGAINLTGTGGSTSGDDSGIFFSGASWQSGTSAKVLSSSGPITLTGTKGTGGSGSGLRFASNAGYFGYDGVNVLNSSSDIVLIADSLGWSGFSNAASNALHSSGTLTVKPLTAGTTIGLAGGTGTLQLTAANFSTNFANGFSGITIGNASAGNITVGGAVSYSDPLTLKTAGNITMNTSSGFTGAVAGGDGIKSSLVLWADADANNGGYIRLGQTAPITTNGGHLWLGGGSGSTTWNGLTVGNGYAQGTAAFPVGIYLDNGAITTAGGHIAMYGKSPVSGSYSNLPDGSLSASGIYSSFANQYSVNAGAGTISMNALGVSTDVNAVGDALYLNGGTLTSAATTGDAITLIGDSSGVASPAVRGAGITIVGWSATKSNTISATAGGNIVLTGTGTTQPDALNSGIRLATTGGGTNDITTTGGGSITLTGTASGIATSSVGFETASDRITSNGNLVVTGNGRPIDLLGGVIVTGTTSLNAPGQNITANNTSNSMSGALAAVGANISVVNSGAMTLGTAGALSGVAATGTIDIATLIGNLTVAQSVATTNTSASALTLNAGKNTAAGTSTGGDIVISGSPVITTGSGGIAKLFTGSVSGSTGLTSLVGSGSSRFRYDSDESTTNYSTVLGAGAYAIYREQPTVTITAVSDSKTYDGLAYSGGHGVTSGGFVNGDTAAVLAGTLTYGGNSQGAINAANYTITPSGYTNGLGYALSFAGGSLTVSKASLTLSGTRVYDGGTLMAGSNLTATGVHGETFSVSGAGATGDLSSKDVQTNQLLASLSGLSLSTSSNGGDSLNYNALSTTGSSVSVTAKTVTLTASKVYDGTTSLTGDVTIGGLIGSEALTYTGATANNAHVATANKYINAITLADGTGGLASNYQLPTLNNTNAPVTITAKALSASANIAGTLTKAYDGTNTAIGATVGGSVTGGVTGDMLTLDTNGVSLAYNGRHVVGTNAITASGSAMLNIDASTASSVASDYSFSAPSIANATASITAATLIPTITNTGVTKVFDGLTTAPADFTPSWSFSGLVNNDSAATLSYSGATYNDPFVGSAKTLTVSGLLLTGITGSNSSASSDYILDATSKSLTAAITGLNSFTSISASLLSTQSTSNASLLSTTNGSNAGAGSLLTLMGQSLFADFTIGTGGRMTLTDDNGTTPVQFSQSGQSLTLMFEGGAHDQAAENLLRLPVFVQAGENVRVSGSFNVLDNGHVLTLTLSDSAEVRIPSPSTLSQNRLLTRYAVNVGDGTGLILEMALSPEQILIIRKSGGSATLDEKKLTLLGLSGAKANMGIPFKALKGVVII